MLNLILILIVLGMALYLIDLIPMDATVKRIIQVLCIFLLVLYVLQALFGLAPPLLLK